MQDDGQKFIIKYAVTTSNEQANRYALFETKNMWTFILLDRYTEIHGSVNIALMVQSISFPFP